MQLLYLETGNNDFIIFGVDDKKSAPFLHENLLIKIKCFLAGFEFFYLFNFEHAK